MDRAKLSSGSVKGTLDSLKGYQLWLSWQGKGSEGAPSALVLPEYRKDFLHLSATFVKTSASQELSEAGEAWMLHHFQMCKLRPRQAKVWDSALEGTGDVRGDGAQKCDDDQRERKTDRIFLGCTQEQASGNVAHD